MEDYIKSTKNKIVQLEQEISKSDSTDHQKRNMQHTLSKINIFSGDVFDYAVKYKAINKKSKEKSDLLADKLDKARVVIAQMKRSMMAHPDHEEGSEFDDFTSAAQKIENEIEILLKDHGDI